MQMQSDLGGNLPQTRRVVLGTCWNSPVRRIASAPGRFRAADLRGVRLSIEDANFATRTLNVRGGKGGKDGVGFFGAEAAQILRAWLGIRREAMLEDYLFVDRMGRSLTGNHAVHILHRLSNRAGLARKVGPHALRHYAATSQRG
jgi:site-specific recombinase XerD